MKKLLILLISFLPFLSMGQAMTWWQVQEGVASANPPSYVSSSNLFYTTNISSPITVSYPSGISVGDVVFLQVNAKSNLSNLNTGGKFTSLASMSASFQSSFYLYYRIIDGTEGSSFSMYDGASNNVDVFAVTSAFTGVNSASFYEDIKSLRSSGTNPTIQSVTSTGNARLAVSFIMVSDDVLSSGEVNYTKFLERTSTSGSDAAFNGYYQEILTAQTVNSEVLTLATSGIYGVVTLLLIPIE